MASLSNLLGRVLKMAGTGIFSKQQSNGILRILIIFRKVTSIHISSFQLNALFEFSNASIIFLLVISSSAPLSAFCEREAAIGNECEEGDFTKAEPSRANVSYASSSHGPIRVIFLWLSLALSANNVFGRNHCNLASFRSPSFHFMTWIFVKWIRQGLCHTFLLQLVTIITPLRMEINQLYRGCQRKT